MTESELTGRRAILWLRCSTDRQTETSIPDQEAAARLFASNHGIVVVDIERLEGLSASFADNVEEVVFRIVQRKRLFNDFDTVLVYDLSRFTRTGIRHGGSLLHELECEGILVVSVTGYSGSSEHGELIDSLSLMAAQHQAKTMANNTARGLQSSLEQKRRASCGISPFGVDKLILDIDGVTPVCLVRMLPGGIQVRLDPKTGHELGRSAFNEKGRPIGRYHKERDHHVVLVPGPREVQEIVVEMFELWTSGCGYYRIAKHLNDRGVLSPRGGKWGIVPVQHLLNNPMYTGEGFANKTTSGVYYQCRVGMPKAVPPSAAFRASGAPKKKRKKRVRPRPKTDWLPVQYEGLANYLPPDLKAKVIEQQHRVREEREKGGKRPYRHKHIESPYFLTGLLKFSPGNEPACGWMRYRHERWYRSRNDHDYPSQRGYLGYPAAPIEEFVLSQVQALVLHTPNLRQLVVDQVVADQKREGATTDRESLDAELKELQARIEFVDAEIRTIGLARAREKIDSLSKRKNEVLKRLGDCGLRQPSREEVEAVVDGVLADLSASARALTALRPSDLRRLLTSVVEVAVLDPRTGDFQLRVRIPFLIESQSERGKRLNPDAPWGSGVEAQARSLYSVDIRTTLQRPTPRGKLRAA